ncbi:hypothetical protein APHAL10511_005384 [Amanita phalloides]|nr:hypothetical protein APHAL10511_005384 [Amanita phalloides]
MSGDHMNGFNYSPTTRNGDHPRHAERHDELASQSGSDEGSTAPFMDSLRSDADFDDDSDALTSQTLNADGTPKRPMNAFMIFARRRRPQVSAENQAMRTGEISKILSKEWAIMPASEKQFYLDRAKQLKESFNTKYPDYVYRRRPNNSRKKSKRRLDASMAGPMDSGNTPETGEDYGGAVGDYDAHPEGDDRHYDPGPNVLHSRIHQDYMGSAQSRSNPYPYVTSDPPYRHDSSHDPRISFLTQHSERLPGETSATSHRLPEIYGYVPSHSQPPPAHLYPTDPGEAHDRWESRVGPARPGWITTHERTMPTTTQRYAQGAPTGWTSAVTSAPASSSSSTPPGTFAFPTLTSPFYPSQAHLQSYQASTSSSSQSDSPVRYDSPTSHSTSGREYDGQNYNSHASVGSENPYADDAVMYQQRLANIPRGLPPVQALAGYSHSSHPASSGPAAPQGY